MLGSELCGAGCGGLALSKEAGGLGDKGHTGKSVEDPLALPYSIRFWLKLCFP